MMSFIRNSFLCTNKLQSFYTPFLRYNKKFKSTSGKVLNRFFLPLIWTTGYLYYTKNFKINCKSVGEDVQKFQNRRDTMKLQNMIQGNRNIFSLIWSIICHIGRFFQLFLIFTPTIVLFPLRNFRFMKDFWLRVFVKAVERAGVVWIKCFQYMSHRRDMIGAQMAQKFMHLRQNAPQHSFKQTKESFFKNYGKKIQQVFQEFDPTPIASGSVSQVYKAKYKGKKVAIKVRHPGVQKYIQRDINILFFFSRFLSLFSPSFSIPVSEVSMKKTLIDQIDFNHEKQNLLIFNQMFKNNKLVKFPQPFAQRTNQAILVQTFAEGVPITYFEHHPHHLNAVIARIGATTFFQMLIKNNFIHADCHGGNIMVQIQQRSYNFFTQIYDFIKQKIQKIEEYFTFNSLSSDTFKQLFADSQKQEQQVRRILKSCKQKVVVTLIDVGMVIRLDQRDRQNFIGFLRSVLHGDGQKCAEMIYGLSLFDGKKIIQGKFEKYMAQLKTLFGQIDGQKVQKLRGLQLMLGMLDIIRQNNMKLQGQFATLITNMLVLQAMAKQLNPQINILKCAVPYFKYSQESPQQMYKQL